MKLSLDFKNIKQMCNKMYRCDCRWFHSVVVAFSVGFGLGQVYYYYFLKQIPFPEQLGRIVSIVISVILGVGNAISIQMRCVSALTLPMYCEKPGRGVLKAVVLTYIVAGPISNMGMNAREVVRVFACSSQLSYNLSIEKYALMLGPLRKASLTRGPEVEDFKNALRSINDVLEPIQSEFEDLAEIAQYRYENDFTDDLFSHRHRSFSIDKKFFTEQNSTTAHVRLYQKKLQYRCENQISRAVAVCIEMFSKAYVKCCEAVPGHAELLLCWPLRLTAMCDLTNSLKKDGDEFCDSSELVPTKFEQAYASLKHVKNELVEKTDQIHLQCKNEQKHDQNLQSAKETVERVIQAFEEKAITMHWIIIILNICVALFAMRIFNASITYHDFYLTDIDYDNVYVTTYFKRLESRRKGKTYVLLPLKKMELNKYVDVHSLSYRVCQRKLVAQVLKVMLEVVTATTFVMLDRLFYEALDVVRQHALVTADQQPTRDLEIEHKLVSLVLKMMLEGRFVMLDWLFYEALDVFRCHALVTADQQPTRDLEIEVEGNGLLAVLLRQLHENLGSSPHVRLVNSNCVPSPLLMPSIFFVKIYGGYLWILILWLLNPYTSRLKRMICSYFYPKREKQRMLHLYNDILKKRMKMDQTLRRKAVQAVRAHYLAGDSLLSWRMRFPRALGWLRVLPAARTTCLLCGDVEPRAPTSACPFVYCGACWREAGARCLACEPGLADLSDGHSLSEHDKPY